MLRGLATVSFFADDIEAAKEWYRALLGVDPYFARSADRRLTSSSASVTTPTSWA